MNTLNMPALYLTSSPSKMAEIQAIPANPLFASKSILSMVTVV